MVGTMDLVVLDDIELGIDADALREELGVGPDRPALVDGLDRIVSEALEVARPKTAYRLASFDKGLGDTVIIDGTPLKSRVLSYHLDDVYRVFPFVATCGTELAGWAETKTDMMEQFWAHAILDRALVCADGHLTKHLEDRYGLENSGVMSPGSLEDWPIEEQRSLFHILGNIEEAIGVHLKESMMMDPLQSVSGIVFPTDADFEECSLCPREDCPKRTAPFEEDLYATRYGGTLDR
jgi:hypothetical protein